MSGMLSEAMELLRELVAVARQIRDELRRRDGSPTV
jgi:hypothetical protein